jgi:protein SDA1
VFLSQVIAVGINSIREIFSRVPSLLREPDMEDFVADLAQYGKKTHKSVMVAAHGIVNLVRSVRDKRHRLMPRQITSL